MHRPCLSGLEIRGFPVENGVLLAFRVCAASGPCRSPSEADLSMSFQELVSNSLRNVRLVMYNPV